MVALSMADGYARLSGKPQCVIVHVDVGTQGLGAAVHNASCGRAPVLIFAGLSPFTLEGEARGTRTEYIHWIQDVPDQKRIVEQYCRYSGEIKTGRNVKQLVGRALQFAMSDPKGPTYLVGAREVMEEDIEPYGLDQAVWGPLGPTALPEEAIKDIAGRLVGAESPLVITGYVGRNHAAVHALVALADVVPGLRVLDTGGSDMCFPASHRGWLGLRYGIDESIGTADVILVIDCDVPWIHSLCRPRKDAYIVHVDQDPLKMQMPVFYIDAQARFRADAATVCKQLAACMLERPELAEKVKGEAFAARWERLAKEHTDRVEEMKMLAVRGQNQNGNFGTSYLCATLRRLVPEDTVFAVEAVTNTVLVADQIRAELPGSWINCGGGGLGWSGGAALGIRLACEDRAKGTGKKPSMVVQIVGDGTFLFTVPSSVYWISEKYNIPVLTVVLGNRGTFYISI
jgi:thiamine pyrophosphate-dependent acetolactate synthase large subunit-like protein